MGIAHYDRVASLLTRVSFVAWFPVQCVDTVSRYRTALAAATDPSR